MFKNVASKVALFVFDTTTGLPKTGDAANLTAYVSKDYGAVTVLGDTSATEMDSTNAKGWYLFDLAQAETNADSLVFTGKSSTANMSLVGKEVFTTPNRFTTMVIDAAGLVDSNAVKLGPSGSGTAQTARDLGTSVLLSSGTGTGQLSLSSGLVTLAGVTHTGAVIPTVTTTGTATAVTTVNGLAANVITAASMAADAGAEIATAVWTDTTAGDFTTALSVGKSLMNGVTLGTGLTVAAVSGAVGSVTGAVGSVTGAVGSVTGAVGSVTGAVGSVGAGGITATSFAANAITAAKLDPDVTTELQAGLATAAALATVDDFLDTEVAAILAAVDTEVAAIKAVTDALPNAGALTDLKADTAAILDDTGTSGVVIAAASKTGMRLSATGVDDILDEVVLGSYTLRQLVRGIAASGLGKLSGAATTTVTIRSADDAKDVVVATVDASGNRSAITLDLA